MRLCSLLICGRLSAHFDVSHMKLFFIFLFVLFAKTATATEPLCTCNPERGCREENGPSYDIGRGVMLSLQSGWRFFHTQLPRIL